MALKLLLIDPSDEWLERAGGYFREKNYEVITADTGKEAQMAIFKTRFFAAVLNLNTANHSGLQVMNFIKSNHPTLKVIFTITDFKDYFDNEDEAKADLRKLGAAEVFMHPFELDELNKIIESNQTYNHIASNITRTGTVSDEVEEEHDDEAFTAIRIDEFISGQAVIFDTFVKIRE